MKSLINNAADKGEQEPYLISIAERAESVMSALEDRRSNADEYRQLKAEIYKVLLKVVSGKRMVDIPSRF